MAEEIKKSRYSLHKKAIIGLADINKDGSIRVEQDFGHNIKTASPFLVAVKSKGNNKYYFKYNSPYKADEENVI